VADPRVNTTERTFVLYDGDVFDQVDTNWFKEPYWRERDLVLDEVFGRGSTLFVSQLDEVWVLRHYRRGGVMAQLTEDKYFWMGLEHTRAFREWRLLSELFDRNMPVPRPVAAYVSREGLSYRASLITTCIQNAQSLASMISGGLVQEFHWQSIGNTLRHFHDENVNHMDLNAHNILIDKQQRVFVVDFDKSGFRRDGAWKKSNVNRLLRSLHKISLEMGTIFDEDGWNCMLSSYNSAS
jgi:3-deoxy-D-manno-octulosonic acid kinase